MLAGHLGRHTTHALILTVGLLAGSVLTCKSQRPADTPSAATATAAPAASIPAQLFAPSPAFAAAAGQGVSIADVAEGAVPSVVNISATRVVRSRSMNPFFGPRSPRAREATALGSGVITSSEGLVVTNNHVVEGASGIQVTLRDGRELEAELVGADPKTDIAVIKLQGNLSDITPIRFGDSSAMRLGDVVLAIGNPMGVGQTVTMGIVSATGRGIGILGPEGYEDFIQTDAAINQGNSGGALINMNGELIGINTAILSRTGQSSGIGFAVPSDMVGPVMTSLVNDGVVHRGYLGVNIQSVDRDLVAKHKLKVKRGVHVPKVMPGSPGARAGLKPNDVITAIDGKKVTSSIKLRNQIAGTKPGTEVALRVNRGGKNLDLKVTLGTLPGDPTTASRTVPSGDGILGGLSLGELDGDTRARYDIPKSVRSGAVVVGVIPGSGADSAGLREGDVILELNNSDVSSPKDFEKLHRRAGRSVSVRVQRGDTLVQLAISR